MQVWFTCRLKDYKRNHRYEGICRVKDKQGIFLGNPHDEEVLRLHRVADDREVQRQGVPEDREVSESEDQKTCRTVGQV